MENVAQFGPEAARVFVTTRWSVIAACKQTDEAVAREALAELCQAYWQPVYICIRHHGHPVHDAQDLTQDFFLRLLKGAWLEHLDQAKGRFRAYLSVALKNFLRERWRRRWALRRRKGGELIPLDASEAENNYTHVPAIYSTPEAVYERLWAKSVIDHSLEQLRIELRADRKEILFQHFNRILTADPESFSYPDAARSLGISPGALRATLLRWRHRFQVLLREEIARTVSSRSEIDDELRHLHRIFAQPE